MEFIIKLLCAAVVIAVARFIISALSAAGKTVLGKGEFKENLNDNFFGLGELEMRLEETEIDTKDGQSIKAVTVDVKGLFPISSPHNTAFVISIIDATEEKTEPVLSLMEEFQEPKTTAFQKYQEIGRIHPNQGYATWARVGGFFPDYIETPYKGKRKLIVFLRLIDLSNPPVIDLGYHQRDSIGILWVNGKTIELEIQNIGYREEKENRVKAHCAIIKIGVYAGMVDGTFTEEEAKSLNEWIPKTLKSYESNIVEAVKTLFNETYKKAFHDYKNGILSVSEICKELNDIGEKFYKYEAIELCFEIIAADKKIDENELTLVHQISQALNLDAREIEKIKDRKLLATESVHTTDTSIEMLLGISLDMSESEINEHLKKEFQKWNSRINTVQEGQERDKAQKMLNLIAEARKKRAA